MSIILIFNGDCREGAVLRNGGDKDTIFVVFASIK
jgi:hypothetical protein